MLSQVGQFPSYIPYLSMIHSNTIATTIPYLGFNKICFQQTIPDLGFNKICFQQILLVFVFKRTHKLYNRVLVLVGMLSRVGKFPSYIPCLAITSNAMATTRSYLG
jgi:hypothetical protein